MRYFAKVHNGVVEQVLVAEPEFFETFIDSSPGTWLETFIDGSFRKNYASRGFFYDAVADVFYEPQPYPSWTLSKPAYIWEPPVPYPTDGDVYRWDERNQRWVP